jgi:hypothetical protein
MSLKESIIQSGINLTKSGDVYIIDKKANKINNNNDNNINTKKRLHESNILKDKEMNNNQETLCENISNNNINSVNFWKEQFMEMKRLKEESEADLTKLAEVKNEQQKSLTQYIDSLESKLKAITGEDKVEGKLEHLSKIAHFYEMLTATTVKLADDGCTYTCTVKNPEKRIAARFTVNYNPDEPNRVFYEPMANISAFPEYMHASLEFGCENAPVLLNDALTTIFAENENDS